MTLSEYKATLTPVECQELKQGLCRIEREGIAFYLVYHYEKLEQQRKQDYARRMNTPVFDDPETQDVVRNWVA